MTRRRMIQQLAAAVSVAGLAGDTPLIAHATTSPQDRQRQVAETERAFAKSMADRDHAAFVSHLSEEAVFFGGSQVFHGRAEVAAAWKHYFEGPAAPFSWEPERVEVLPSGTLGFSSGPVRGPDGKRAGTFNSVWRLEQDGTWRIVFDIGCPRA
jgi:ketosteroid isomerase-like protein